MGVLNVQRCNISDVNMLENVYNLIITCYDKK
jgi:hypothetical protein